MISSLYQGCTTILYTCGDAQSKHDGLSMEKGLVTWDTSVCVYDESESESECDVHASVRVRKIEQ